MRRALVSAILVLLVAGPATARTHRARLARPSKGLQLRLTPVEVAPRREREVCQVVTVRSKQPIDVGRLDFALGGSGRLGSHHFAVFAPVGALRAHLPPGPYDNVGCVSTSAEFVSPILAFVQRRRERIAFPPGVGVRILPGQRLLLNAHFVNDGDAAGRVDAAVNLRPAPKGSIRHYARSFQLGTTRIRIAPQSEGSAEGQWIAPVPMNVIMLSTHSHKHTASVAVELIRGGVPVAAEVTTTDWSDPAVKEYRETPLRLETGDGFRWTCNYRNDATVPLTFGVTAEDEMCFAIGFYYPDDETPLRVPRGCITSGPNGLVCPFN